MNDFNPNSIDANLARILERQMAQDAILQRIDARMENDGRRLTSLEREKWLQRGVVATISAGAAAFGTFLARK